MPVLHFPFLEWRRCFWFKVPGGVSVFLSKRDQIDMRSLFFFLLGDSGKVTTVVATPGQGPDRPQEVSYTDIKVIGNGSFGVVYQARLIDSQEMVAIKKVLQDKRFKV